MSNLTPEQALVAKCTAAELAKLSRRADLSEEVRGQLRGLAIQLIDVLDLDVSAANLWRDAAAAAHRLELHRLAAALDRLIAEQARPEIVISVPLEGGRATASGLSDHRPGGGRSAARACGQGARADACKFGTTRRSSRVGEETIPHPRYHDRADGARRRGLLGSPPAHDGRSMNDMEKIAAAADAKIARLGEQLIALSRERDELRRELDRAEVEMVGSVHTEAKHEPICVSFMLQRAFIPDEGYRTTAELKDEVYLVVRREGQDSTCAAVAPYPEEITEFYPYDERGWAGWQARWAPGELVDGHYRLVAAVRGQPGITTETFVVEHGRRR